MLDGKQDEKISLGIQELNRQIEMRQSAMETLKREKETRMRDFDDRIKCENDEIARLEGQMVEMKKQLR